VPVLTDMLINNGNEELEGITDPVARDEMLKDALSLSGPDRGAGKDILLIDDLYRSGSTLRIATDMLYHEANADGVCVLTMTKTRSTR